MDTDDDEVLPRSRGATSTGRSWMTDTGNKHRTKEIPGGILSESYSSPSHEPPTKTTKGRGQWLDRNDDDDTLTMISQSRTRTAATVRPVTAMSTSQADLIPDLDDMEADVIGEAVKAPLLEPSNLSSYQDLEQDILKHPAFASFDGINMSPLFARLLPEKDVIEEDVVWTWDNLIASVSMHVPSKEDK